MWRTMRLIYRRLTGGLELPDVMPMRESRAIDAIVGGRGAPLRVIEVDEGQHFNEFRLLTLRLYPKNALLAFPVHTWMSECRRRKAIGGGGWSKPKPPLFPMAGGRHRQRAFRDALADLLPPLYGYGPTLRIAEFEVDEWMYDRNAVARMRALLDERLNAEPQVTGG
jgi:hypothetical protein